jgi:uncharacterized YigZ family protein
VRYPIPAHRHRVEQLVERSRFVCTLAAAHDASQAQAVVRDVAGSMPDAHHHCWAYVAGPPGSTDQVGSSDDGEPRGTAGRPMLVVLLHSGVGDVVAIVSRYFGGVKLGTGGLARAYGGVVQLGLASLPRAERVTRMSCAIELAYAQLSAVQQLLPRFEATVQHQLFGATVRLALTVPSEAVAALRQALLDATRGEVQLTMDGAGAP